LSCSSSRSPIWQALARLSLEGATTSSTAGTFVARANPGFSGNLLSTQALVNQEPESFGPDFEERILFAGRIEVEGRPAEMLGLEDGSLAIRRDRQRFANGQPLTMSSAWFPWTIGRHLADLLICETGPGQKALEEASGLVATRLEEWVKADTATPEQAAFFGIEEGSPVKVTDHLWVTDDGTVMVYGSGVHRMGEWSRYWVELTDGQL
jgi:DNA-binding GntR family transcriptional regulator